MAMRERGVEVGGRSESNIAVYRVRVIHLGYVCMLCHACVCVVGEHLFPPHSTCKYSLSALTVEHLRQHFYFLLPRRLDRIRFE